MLIAMAVWDTEENKRAWMTRDTLLSLARTVDFDQHRLVISDNGSCAETHEVYKEMAPHLSLKVLFNGKNIGTANAINIAWKERRPGEHAVKMDNDVVIHQPCWADWMEDVFRRDPEIGICGLKRVDVDEAPWNPPGWSKSTLRMLPHKRGQRWLVVEEVQHVIGTCQAYSSALLDRIGFLYQPGVYGFDDSLAAVRAKVAGFKSAFLHGFEITHLDEPTNYTGWKRAQASMHMKAYHKLRRKCEIGELPVYYDGEGEWDS
jgi:GT2 family glycosyltransferase